MDIFNNLAKATVDVLKVATAPVEVAAVVAQAVTKPVREAADEVVDMTKEIFDEDHKS